MNDPKQTEPPVSQDSLDEQPKTQTDYPSLHETVNPPVAHQSEADSINMTPTIVGGAPVELHEGDMLRTFRIERKLGEGGMGQVWKAYDTVGDVHVVIKTLPPSLQANYEEMERVKETFQRVFKLHHPHICPVFPLGHDDRLGYFLVMKYVDGVTLFTYSRKYRKEFGDLPIDEVIRVLRPIAEALDHAHANKVVHRDVKPQNVMIGLDGGNPQLVDFGLAADIRSSMAMVSNVQMDRSGTYPYMAPEQWRGQYQDGQSDQYALAVMAYEMLSDRLPFDAPDPLILARCVLNEQPLEIEEQPAQVNRTLQKALGKNRKQRFSCCAEFIEALAGNVEVGEPAEFFLAEEPDVKAGDKTGEAKLRGDLAEGKAKGSQSNKPKPPPIPSAEGIDSALAHELAGKLRQTATTGKEQMRRQKLIQMLHDLLCAHGTVRRSGYKWLVALQVLPMLPICGGAGTGIGAIVYEMTVQSVDRGGWTYREGNWGLAISFGIMGGLGLLTALCILLGWWRRARKRRAEEKLRTLPQEIASKYPIECAAWGGTEVLEHPPLVRDLIIALRPKPETRPSHYSGLATGEDARRLKRSN